MSVILEVILKVSSRRHLLFYTILYMYNVNMNIAFSEGLYLNMISTLSSLRALDSKSHFTNINPNSNELISHTILSTY
jgi:hypothetical protein